MKIDGACHCGYIRVEGDADPEKTAVCHCTDCQVGNGSAFRVNVPVPGATFRITGQPATYLKTTAESGHPRLQAFCPRCGSPIYSTSPSPWPGLSPTPIYPTCEAPRSGESELRHPRLCSTGGLWPNWRAVAQCGLSERRYPTQPCRWPAKAVSMRALRQNANSPDWPSNRRANAMKIQAFFL